jgi:hypothetical protein
MELALDYPPLPMTAPRADYRFYKRFTNLILNINDKLSLYGNFRYV